MTAIYAAIKKIEIVRSAFLIKQDWIVEKDGVVYEEHHPFVDKKDLFKTYKENIICPWCGGNQMIKLGDTPKHACVCVTCGKMSTICIASRIHEQDLPAELEESSGQYEEIKMPLNEKYKIDANAVFETALHEAALRIKRLEQEAIEKDEDWLEKKMLCFVRRHAMPGNPGVIQSKYRKVLGKCYDADCPFCFPDAVKSAWQENAKFFTEINNIRQNKPCTCTQVGSERILCTHCVKRYIEEPREKVTVEDMSFSVSQLESIAYSIGQNKRNTTNLDRELLHRSLTETLEYLVSLQEKE